MKPQPLISRKEIATLLGDNFTVRQVARNEVAWGLHKARAKLSTRVVFYRRGAALLALRSLGAEL